MKHRLAALFLAAALFCTLLAGCAPTPDVPGPNGGSSSSSGSTNNGGNSESEDNNSGGNTATKLQPKAYMEAYNVSYITSKIISKNPYVANYVFSVVNPNKNYSLSSVKISIDLTDNNGKPLTDYTTIQSIAPGDTVRFAYSASYSVPVHIGGCRVDPVLSSYFKTPETESDGTPKMAKSSDITVVGAKETKTSSKFDYNIINGTALNTSHYPCKVKVSLLLKKNGQTVYATWVNSPSDVLANGTFPVTIYAPKNIDYDSFDLIAIPC